MEYLRRLHPSQAAPPGAARLDRPPRFAAAASPADPEPPIAVPMLEAEAEPLPRAPSRVAASPVAAFAEPPAAPAATTVTVEHRHRTEVEVVAARPVRAAAEQGPLAANIERPLRIGVPAAQAEAAAAMAAAPDTLSPAVAPLPAEATRAAPTALPLREQTLREHAMSKPADPAPVVHVTIDRIDVRLPPPAAAAPRKTRPASAVAPLSDYLRGGGRG